MNRYLVTGARGFIGSAVVRRLEAYGHEVTAFKGDLLADEPLQLPYASHCIHTAWYTNHSDYLTSEANREWLVASLRLARAFVGRFIGLGTCLEYDVSGGGPCAEDRTPVRPDTLYARCKTELSNALANDGSDFAWARVFFVYGPGDRAGRLVPSMIERFSRGERAGPTFGGLRRDYIHVDDLADQIVRIANSSFRGRINTGTGQGPTLSEIFAAGATAFGRPELAEANDETGDQPPAIQADTNQFRRVIGDPGARDIVTGLRGLIG